MKYEKELEFIEKQIKKTEISIQNTKNKPNVSNTEIDNLNSKLNIFNNIRDLILKQV